MLEDPEMPEEPRSSIELADVVAMVAALTLIPPAVAWLLLTAAAVAGGGSGFFSELSLIGFVSLLCGGLAAFPSVARARLRIRILVSLGLVLGLTLAATAALSDGPWTGLDLWLWVLPTLGGSLLLLLLWLPRSREFGPNE